MKILPRGVVFARAAARGYLSRMQRGTVIPQQASTEEDQIPYFRGSRTAPPRAVTEPILYQGGPYGLVVVARDTERK